MIDETKLCLIKMPEGHTDANGSVCIDAIKYYVGKYSYYYSTETCSAFIVNDSVMYFPSQIVQFKYLRTGE